MSPDARDRRFAALRNLGCLTCPGCGQVEIHHLNKGGHAGQERRGDEFTIPLGKWAHRGEPRFGYTASEMEQEFGPSLARQSKAFREKYGDDDFLLAKANRLIAPAVVPA